MTISGWWWSGGGEGGAYRVANQITGGAGTPRATMEAPPLDMYIILKKNPLRCQICFKVCIYVGVSAHYLQSSDGLGNSITRS